MNVGKGFAEHISYQQSKNRSKLNIDAALSWREGMVSGLEANFEETRAPELTFRLVLIIVTLVFSFLLLFSRSFRLQVIEGHKNFLLSEENRLRIKRVQPERGVVYTREEVVITQNAPAFTVVVDLTEIDPADILPVVEKVSLILPVSGEEMVSKIEQGFAQGLQEVVILRGVARDAVLALETQPDQLRGVYTDIAPVRQYLEGEKYAHLIGYTGEVSASELEQSYAVDYQLGDTIGKTGLELVYEEYLHGKVGRVLLERDAEGKKKREVAHEKAVVGNDLHLTIDHKLQLTAYEALAKQVTTGDFVGGAVVVMDPQTGAILSLVSYPSYDPNIFSGNLTKQAYEALLQDENLPLFNRTIGALYPPASTFKLVSAVAALEEGVVTPTTEVEEVQFITVGGRNFANWTLAWGVAPHGWLDLSGAIAQSSDIYFYEVGGGYADQVGMGPEAIAHWAREFGLGSRTGLDLNGEVEGLVPDRAFKQQVKGEEWYLGDTYNLVIGQGDLLATPLQVASYTATVANGGTLYRPYLVTRVVDPEGNLVESFGANPLKTVSSPENINEVRLGMKEAVAYGTSVVLRDHPGDICAKTGTAETGDAERLHAWFTSFAPYEKPELVVTVFIEEGGSGSDTALAVARAIYDTYFNVKP